MISLGFEPRTHSLEGCCSNPTELRNLNSAAKVIKIYDIIKFIGKVFITILDFNVNNIDSGLKYIWEYGSDKPYPHIK